MTDTLLIWRSPCSLGVWQRQIPRDRRQKRTDTGAPVPQEELQLWNPHALRETKDALSNPVAGQAFQQKNPRQGLP